MKPGNCMRFVSVVMLASAPWAVAASTQVIHSFSGIPDGEYPSTDLVIDGAGNLYGMSVQGGDFGAGTVFELTPSGGGFTESVLYSFTGGADGGQPYGGVTLDGQGNVYGTTVIGGTGGVCAEDGCGTVWKLANSGGKWQQSVIYSFTGAADGGGAGGPVVFDALGNIYGMTPTGGAYGLGVIYRLTPDSSGGWIQSVIHTFTGGLDGGTGSAGRLIFDTSGAIFGVATVGGANGAGIVFQLTPTVSGPWTQATLYSFKGQPDAGFPYGGLVRDATGNFYGTTYYDGANGLGSVYRLAFRNGSWKETVLYSFKGGKDGSNSISGLILDSKGNLFGTTSEGGAAGCSCGTIFKMIPGERGRWEESVVYRFQGAPDGAYSYNGLVADPAGNLYGTTVHGGADDDGVAYKFTP